MTEAERTASRISDAGLAPDRGCLAPFHSTDPLITALGPIHWTASDEMVVMRIDPSRAAQNAGGTIHGGALSAWLDMAMYELAKRSLGACVTVSLDVQFLTAGARAPLTATARFLRAGRGMAFCAAEIIQAGQNISAGTAIYKRSGP